MAVPRGLVLALDLHRTPLLAEAMRRQPVLPSGEMLVLLRIAGGCTSTSLKAIEATGRSLDDINTAVAFYLKQVLLFPDADSYRILGVDPQAPQRTVREHLHWMMRWLHPDRNRNSRETVLACRVLSAWEDLKSPSRRKDYDRRRGDRAMAVAPPSRPRAQASTRRPGVPWVATPLPRRQTALRLFGYMAGAALLAWLGWQVILNISPRHSAAAVTPDASPADLVRRMETHILRAGDGVDWAEIGRTARNVLRQSPLESRAFFLLGLAAESEGREANAAALMSIAAARSLRNRGAHLWLFSYRLREREFGPALPHADAILRTRPQLGATLLPGLMAIASSHAGRAPLVRMLETGPPWRAWFLGEFSRQAASPSDPSPLYGALQAGPLPPSSGELRAYLDRLIGSDQFDQAFVLWLSSLAPDERQDLKYLSNGDFEHPVSNLPFDWVISRIRGAEIDVSESPIDTGKALRIQFARARVAFRHVRKLLMLPPGDYQLSGKARSLDLRNDRGLRWNVTCAGGSKERLASTAPANGTMTADIMLPLTVPSQGCRAQWLQLELAARIPSEQDVGGGIVWYDSLRIRRRPDP